MDTQVWPAPTNAPQVRARDVDSSGASGMTMAGSNPESSATAGIPRSASVARKRLPFSTLPVNTLLSTAAWLKALADLRSSKDGRDQAVGKPDVTQAMQKRPPGQHCQIRRLPDHRIARRECLSDHRRIQEEGIIPGADESDNSHRAVTHTRRTDLQEPLMAGSEGLVGDRFAAVLNGPAAIERGNDVAGHGLGTGLSDLITDEVGPPFGVTRQGLPPILEKCLRLFAQVVVDQPSLSFMGTCDDPGHIADGRDLHPPKFYARWRGFGRASVSYVTVGMLMNPTHPVDRVAADSSAALVRDGGGPIRGPRQVITARQAHPQRAHQHPVHDQVRKRIKGRVPRTGN